MPKIKVNDISLYYEEYGQGEPVVFVGGFSADHLGWSAVVKEFSQKHRVVVFDNRGVGQSDCPDYTYTVEMMADDTAALCKVLNISKAHFVGNSLGGMIVQNIAYKYPQLTKTAVISNSVVKYFSIGFKLLIEGQLELIEIAAPIAAIAKVGLGCIFSEKFLSQPGMSDGLIKYQVENKYPMTAIGFKNQIHATKTFDASNFADKITCPCLVIGADEDRIAPEKQARAVAKIIPNAQYFCFEGGVGHLPHIEQPELFSKVVLDFIAKNS